MAVSYTHLDVYKRQVLLSTIFFRIFGIENWKIMALIWAIVPIVNGITFTKVPIATLIEEGETGMTIRELCRNKTFWILMLMMLCAGASEQGVSPVSYTHLDVYKRQLHSLLCQSN